MLIPHRVKMVSISTSNMTWNNKKKHFGTRKRKNKLVIVFDEEARREYLTGFHKRKLERKRKAKEELDKQIKLERKRIKAKAKEQYKKMLLSTKPISNFENLLCDEIDMGTHSVSVTELSPAELAKKNNWIGINKVKYEEETTTTRAESEEEKSDQELEGMEINSFTQEKPVFKNVKDIKKVIQKQATLNIKNSKVFQKKAKYDKIKSIKLKKREEKKKKKMQRKNKKCKI